MTRGHPCPLDVPLCPHHRPSWRPSSPHLPSGPPGSGPATACLSAPPPASRCPTPRAPGRQPLLSGTQREVRLENPVTTSRKSERWAGQGGSTGWGGGGAGTGLRAPPSHVLSAHWGGPWTCWGRGHQAGHRMGPRRPACWPQPASWHRGQRPSGRGHPGAGAAAGGGRHPPPRWAAVLGGTGGPLIPAQWSRAGGAAFPDPAKGDFVRLPPPPRGDSDLFSLPGVGPKTRRQWGCWPTSPPRGAWAGLPHVHLGPGHTLASAARRGLEGRRGPRSLAGGRGRPAHMPPARNHTHPGGAFPTQPRGRPAPRQAGRLEVGHGARRRVQGTGDRGQGRGLQGWLLRDHPLHRPRKSSNVALCRKP